MEHHNSVSKAKSKGITEYTSYISLSHVNIHLKFLFLKTREHSSVRMIIVNVSSCMFRSREYISKREIIRSIQIALNKVYENEEESLEMAVLIVRICAKQPGMLLGLEMSNQNVKMSYDEFK